MTPPIGSRRPVRVISPVMANPLAEATPRTADSIAAARVMPAEGPSLGMAPSGTCTWMSRSFAKSAGMPSSACRARRKDKGGLRALLHHVAEAPRQQQLALAREDRDLHGQQLPAELGPRETVRQARASPPGRTSSRCTSPCRGRSPRCGPVTVTCSSGAGGAAGGGRLGRGRSSGGDGLGAAAGRRHRRDVAGTRSIGRRRPPRRSRRAGGWHGARPPRRPRRRRRLGLGERRHQPALHRVARDLPQYVGDLALEVAHPRLEGVATG